MSDQFEPTTPGVRAAQETAARSRRRADGASNFAEGFTSLLESVPGFFTQFNAWQTNETISGFQNGSSQFQVGFQRKYENSGLSPLQIAEIYEREFNAFMDEAMNSAKTQSGRDWIEQNGALFRDSQLLQLEREEFANYVAAQNAQMEQDLSNAVARGDWTSAEDLIERHLAADLIDEPTAIRLRSGSANEIQRNQLLSEARELLNAGAYEAAQSLIDNYDGELDGEVLTEDDKDWVRQKLNQRDSVNQTARTRRRQQELATYHNDLEEMWNEFDWLGGDIDAVLDQLEDMINSVDPNGDFTQAQAMHEHYVLKFLNSNEDYEKAKARGEIDLPHDFWMQLHELRMTGRLNEESYRHNAWTLYDLFRETEGYENADATTQRIWADLFEDELAKGPFTQQAHREAFEQTDRFLQSMVDDGLIDPGTMVDSQRQLYQLMAETDDPQDLVVWMNNRMNTLTEEALFDDKIGMLASVFQGIVPWLDPAKNVSGMDRFLYQVEEQGISFYSQDIKDLAYRFTRDSLGVVELESDNPREMQQQVVDMLTQQYRQQSGRRVITRSEEVDLNTAAAIALLSAHNYQVGENFFKEHEISNELINGFDLRTGEPVVMFYDDRAEHDGVDIPDGFRLVTRVRTSVDDLAFDDEGNLNQAVQVVSEDAVWVDSSDREIPRNQLPEELRKYASYQRQVEGFEDTYYAQDIIRREEEREENVQEAAAGFEARIDVLNSNRAMTALNLDYESAMGYAGQLNERFLNLQANNPELAGQISQEERAMLEITTSDSHRNWRPEELGRLLAAPAQAFVRGMRKREDRRTPFERLLILAFADDSQIADIYDEILGGE